MDKCSKCGAPIDPELGDCLVCSELLNRQAVLSGKTARNKEETEPQPRRRKRARGPVKVPVRNEQNSKTRRESAICHFMGMEIDDPPPGPNPLLILVLIVMLIIGGIGALFVLSGNLLGGDDIPTVALSSKRTGEFTYRVTVTKASPATGLDSFSYNLKDDFNLIPQFGKISLQNMSGQWEGIDITWDDAGDLDVNPGNGMADREATAGGPYSDPAQAQVRITDILVGGQGNTSYQRGEGAISISFLDQDRDGRLSLDDIFLVRANSQYHPANDDFKLEVVFDPEESIVCRSKLGPKRIYTPNINLESIKDSNKTYHVKIVDTTEIKNITMFQFYLKDSGGTTQQYGEISLQEINDKWQGIDITWDDDGDYDQDPGNGRADRNGSAGEPYSDPVKAQNRIDDIKGGNHSGVPISVSFFDHDQNGELTPGDEFVVLGNRKDHEANDDYIFEIKYKLNFETAGSTYLA